MCSCLRMVFMCVHYLCVFINSSHKIYSFGEFNNFFLDLQKVQEIIRKTPLDFLAIVLNDIL